MPRQQSSLRSVAAGQRKGSAYAAIVGGPSRAESLRDRVGCTEPRIFTPPLRELTPETSKGFACIEFAKDILEIELLPWQKWLLIHALELNEDGSYRFRTVVLLVARQNGKSTLMLVLALWRMYADAAPLVIGTAQNLDIAEELWTEAYELAESIPELEAMIEHVDKTNGKKALRLTTGERYKVAAASRRGGRGLSGDLVLLDELREHQTWDAWGAVTKTTLARRLAQVWAASNAGDAASIVLRYLRSIAHQELGFPDGKAGLSVIDAVSPDDELAADSSLGIFEWSAAPGRAVTDREGWAEANPALGTLITEVAIASSARTDPEWVFRTEVMCQWVNLIGAGPFPTGAWAKTSVPQVERDASRPAVYGVDLSFNRTMAYIAIAFWDTLGRKRVEIAAQRAGTDWIIPWLLDPERRVKPDDVTLQSKGAPISSMKDSLETSGIRVHDWSGSDLAGWTGQFYDEIRKATDDDDAELTMTHGVWPALDIAANSARVKPMGDGWTIDRKSSPEDAAPLMAAIGAVGLLSSLSTATTSAYETSELMFLD